MSTFVFLYVFMCVFIFTYMRVQNIGDVRLGVGESARVRGYLSSITVSSTCLAREKIRNMTSDCLGRSR